MTQLSIQGETFEIATPYGAGAVLNAEEASVLNQTYRENIRNNVAGKIKAAKEKAEKDGKQFSMDTPVEGDEGGRSLRTILTDYATNYKFGMRVERASEPVDPVEREARSIAKGIVNEKLRANGTKRKDITDEQYEGLVAKVAARDNVTAEAKRRVNARSKIGADELDFELPEAAAA